MALTQKVIDELKKEAKELEIKLSELDQEMATIQRKRTSALQEKSSLETIIAANVSEPNTFMVELAKLADAHHPSRSFRESIREVIKESASPLKPKQVEIALRASGFEEPKEMKTPLSTRIGNELFKLTKNGDLVRADGGYTINK